MAETHVHLLHADGVEELAQKLVGILLAEIEVLIVLFAELCEDISAQDSRGSADVREGRRTWGSCFPVCGCSGCPMRIGVRRRGCHRWEERLSRADRAHERGHDRL